jgi:hypothetical protein
VVSPELGTPFKNVADAVNRLIPMHLLGSDPDRYDEDRFQTKRLKCMSVARVSVC